MSSHEYLLVEPLDDDVVVLPLAPDEPDDELPDDEEPPDEVPSLDEPDELDEPPEHATMREEPKKSAARIRFMEPRWT